MNEFLLEQAKNYFGNTVQAKVVSTTMFCLLRDDTCGNSLNVNKNQSKTDHE